jgi:hypothetical protein
VSKRGLGLSLAGLAIALVYLIPVYWMVATSLKEPGDVFNSPPDLVPTPPTLAAYEDAVFGSSAVLQGIWSSTSITIPTLVLTLALAVPAAYGLARFSLRINGVVMLLMLAAQMLPTISLALPMFAIFSDYGLVDTYAGLVIANTSLALPFAVVMLRRLHRFPRVLADRSAAGATGSGDGCDADVRHDVGRVRVRPDVGRQRRDPADHGGPEQVRGSVRHPVDEPDGGLDHHRRPHHRRLRAASEVRGGGHLRGRHQGLSMVVDRWIH